MNLRLTTILGFILLFVSGNRDDIVVDVDSKINEVIFSINVVNVSLNPVYELATGASVYLTIATASGASTDYTLEQIAWKGGGCLDAFVAQANDLPNAAWLNRK